MVTSPFLGVSLRNLHLWGKHQPSRLDGLGNEGGTIHKEAGATGARRGPSRQTGTHGCRLVCAAHGFAEMMRHPTRRGRTYSVTVGADASLRLTHSAGSAAGGTLQLELWLGGTGGLEGADPVAPQPTQEPGLLWESRWKGQDAGSDSG